MANSNERVKYYRIGEFAAIMMLKGIIHPDMQENNLGIRNGVVVTNDFADVKFFDFPEGINSKVVKQHPALWEQQWQALGYLVSFLDWRILVSSNGKNMSH